MLASEAHGGGGRTPEERIVALVVVALGAGTVICWTLVKLHALYVSVPLRMAEDLLATFAHGGLRLPAEVSEELREGYKRQGLQ